MTQTTYDPATVDPHDTTVVWSPEGTSDYGLWLCTPHAIREFNSHLFVALGLVPKASNLTQVRMQSTETGKSISFEGHAADADHACAACADGAPLDLEPYADEAPLNVSEDGEAADADDATDEAAAGELAEVLQFVNPHQEKTDE
jgi:hypothetical protein